MSAFPSGFKVPAKYTRTAIFFHWLIALLITSNLVLVWIVDSLPESAERPVIDTHKSIGITVLGLAILRILWRLSHRPPALPATYSAWERSFAHLAHVLLYVLIVSLPLSGWLHDSAWKDAAGHPMTLFGLVPWPRLGFIMNLDPVQKEGLHEIFFQIHRFLAYGLYALVVLHIGGALKHQFFDKHPELQRMLP